MSEPMFVISEDEMKNIIDLTEEMCETPGWVINVQPIASRRMDIINKIRSHPLSSALEESYKNGFNDGQAEGMPLELSTDDAIPFSDWLSIHDTTIRKLEREKMLDDLCNLFRWTNKEGNFRPWNIGHIEQVIRKYRESLRSER